RGMSSGGAVALGQAGEPRPSLPRVRGTHTTMPSGRSARSTRGDTCRTDGRVITSRGKHGAVNTSHPHPTDVVVIGAGPAGLTAALRLAERGVLPVIVEGDDVVGGISRTVVRDDWRFDIGGHRFFTKVPEVEELWGDLLPGDELMRRPRLSRIYY